ncbi:MAG: hypothetical protein ACR2JH_09030 [Solirubrobacteraceae bacterium]
MSGSGFRPWAIAAIAAAVAAAFPAGPRFAGAPRPTRSREVLRAGGWLG